MQYLLGCNSQQSNGINYEEFRESYYFSYYELATSSSLTQFLLPSTRSGTIRINVEFSQGCFEVLIAE